MAYSKKMSSHGMSHEHLEINVPHFFPLNGDADHRGLVISHTTTGTFAICSCQRLANMPTFDDEQQHPRNYLDHSGDAYRAVYALQIDEAICVVYAFQKKSTRGIRTPKREIDLIRERIKRLMEQL